MMKQYLVLIALSIFTFGCEKNNPTGYTIDGEAKEIYNGVRVYLQHDENGKQVPVDTAIVMNEKFQFKGAVDNPSFYFVTINGVNGSKMFMLENSEIQFKVNKQDFIKSEIIGSKSNDDLIQYQADLSKLNEYRQKLIVDYQKVNQQKDREAIDSMAKIMTSHAELIEGYSLKFAEENPDAYFSLNLIEFELRKPNVNVNTINKVFTNLDENIKNSKKGNEINEKINELFKEKEKLAHLEVGKKAPNFEAPNTEGKTVSLEDLKGKVTIIDFWAAWCGPCRRENPNVVKIYEQFHDDGLEIIGVSLDGTPRQKDPKQAWLQAIEKDKLTWNHVSSLNYFNDPVAQLYNITSIPATYILDESGTIVAKNLRGVALENTVKKLLNK